MARPWENVLVCDPFRACRSVLVWSDAFDTRQHYVPREMFPLAATRAASGDRVLVRFVGNVRFWCVLHEVEFPMSESQYFQTEWAQNTVLFTQTLARWFGPGWRGELGVPAAQGERPDVRLQELADAVRERRSAAAMVSAHS